MLFERNCLSHFFGALAFELPLTDDKNYNTLHYDAQYTRTAELPSFIFDINRDRYRSKHNPYSYCKDKISAAFLRTKKNSMRFYLLVGARYTGGTLVASLK